MNEEKKPDIIPQKEQFFFEKLPQPKSIFHTIIRAKLNQDIS